ncbi:hypothetical protein JOM56_014970 [Amanita muscaria]
MSGSKLIFYDVKAKKAGFSWSPNTWKTRFTLNYKGIPYETVWLEYPEIQAKSKELGVGPTKTKADGSPVYTVPIIWDPATKTAVSDSYTIAKYLDAAYPNTPRVLFDGIEEYDIAIQAFYGLPEMRALFDLVAPYVTILLTPVSQEYKLKDESWPKAVPTGDKKVEAWKVVKNGFDIVDGLLKKNGGPFARGEQISFVDFAFGGYVFGLRLVWGEDNELWKDLATWNNGRWSRLVEKLDKYTTPQGVSA